MIASLLRRLWHLVVTPYEPAPTEAGYLERAQVQEDPRARVTVAVLSAAESHRLFGVDLARRGIQPVFVRIENRSPEPLRLQRKPRAPCATRHKRGGHTQPAPHNYNRTKLSRCLYVGRFVCPSVCLLIC